jgi:hypothetical protein
MHDCPPGIATCTNNDKELHGDQWLQQTIAAILSQSSFQKNGLMIISWDESWDNDNRNGGGHIPVILVGPQVKRGYAGNNYMQLESVLRLICETLQVPNTLGAASNATSMSDYLIAAEGSAQPAP